MTGRRRGRRARNAGKAASPGFRKPLQLTKAGPLGGGQPDQVRLRVAGPGPGGDALGRDGAEPQAHGPVEDGRLVVHGREDDRRRQGDPGQPHGQAGVGRGQGAEERGRHGPEERLAQAHRPGLREPEQQAVVDDPVEPLGQDHGAQGWRRIQYPAGRDNTVTGPKTRPSSPAGAPAPGRGLGCQGGGGLTPCHRRWVGGPAAARTRTCAPRGVRGRPRPMSGAGMRGDLGRPSSHLLRPVPAQLSRERRVRRLADRDAAVRWLLRAALRRLDEGAGGR